jgi:hypothetical protein
MGKVVVDMETLNCFLGHVDGIYPASILAMEFTVITLSSDTVICYVALFRVSLLLPRL